MTDGPDRFHRNGCPRVRFALLALLQLAARSSRSPLARGRNKASTFGRWSLRFLKRNRVTTLHRLQLAVRRHKDGQLKVRRGALQTMRELVPRAIPKDEQQEVLARCDAALMAVEGENNNINSCRVCEPTARARHVSLCALLQKLQEEEEKVV
jgi:hypothetical protein